MQPMDLNTLIKRPEILKNGIAINDMDDIEFQLKKLKKIDISLQEQKI